MLGLIGKKIGMTHVYAKDDSFVPVTVVQVMPHVILSVKTKDKNRYSAVQLACKEKKEDKVKKPLRGQFKAGKLDCFSWIKEFRTERSQDFQIGFQVKVEALKVGEKVDIQGTSKGKGFQGVIKRHGFAGGCDSHGNSVSHRVPGSIGQNSYPGRVIPNKRMPGHMGAKTVTMKNLEVVGIEGEQNIVLIKGAIPGSNNSRIYIYPSSSDFETRVLANNDRTKKNDADKNTGEKKTEAAASAA